MSNYFTEKILKYFIENEGPNFPMTSTNCQNKPAKVGDYSVFYGTAQELLDNLKKGIKTYYI